MANYTLYLALGFLILGLIMIFFIVLYIIFWAPKLTNPPCTTDANCQLSETCVNNFCSEIVCTADDDFGVCLNSYWYPKTCLTSTDCPDQSACLSGFCTEIKTACTTNNDCHSSLTCMNNLCVECNSNTDCPIGTSCQNNICKYGDSSEMVDDTELLYLSNAQFNGNISAPYGYYCSTASCGDLQTCSDQTSCPQSCPYCVNSVCRCVIGTLYESCSTNLDCQSGLCSETSQGRICVPSAGQCAFNYNKTGSTGSCPYPSAPYCINGICSAISEGALCGAHGDPENLCSNPEVLTGHRFSDSGLNPDGMGFFCVNGRCQMTPGPLNSLCTMNSCAFIDSGALVCSDGRCKNVSKNISTKKH